MIAVEQPVVERDGRVTCHQCESTYKSLAQHWSKSENCNYPDLGQDQKDLIHGLVMGDGWFSSTTGNRNVYVATEMQSSEFLTWVSNQLGNLSKGVSPRNDRDIYYLSTRSIPELTQMKEKWYSGGSKSFPDCITLSQLSLSIWYACDGSLHWDGRGNYVQSVIYNYDQNLNQDYVDSMFSEVNFEPSVTDTSIRFTQSETYELVDYMIEVPGYEYKFEVSSKSKYNDAKN